MSGVWSRHAEDRLASIRKMKATLMSQEKFIYHQDPSHGWIAVPRKFCEELGILKDITTYSYERRGTVYLEEDCDGTRFCKAFRDKFGCDPRLEELHTNNPSAIRYYNSFRP